MNNKLLKYIPFIFFSVYFLLGIFIYKDFGIGIEEHFQRKNGFFWLIHFFEFFDFFWNFWSIEERDEDEESEREFR